MCEIMEKQRKSRTGVREIGRKNAFRGSFLLATHVQMSSQSMTRTIKLFILNSTKHEKYHAHKS